jgi:hypothetical protein
MAEPELEPLDSRLLLRLGRNIDVRRANLQALRAQADALRSSSM